MGASLVAATATIGALQVASAAPRVDTTQLGLVLRLHDLPLGYETGFECAPLQHPEDTPAKLTEFIDRFAPEGCIDAYERLYRVEGQGLDPPAIGSAVLDAGNTAAADAGFAVVPELISRINDDRDAEEVAPTTLVGDATRLFHAGDIPFDNPRIDFGSILVWRSGNALAAVLVAGRSFAADDRMAVEFARRQQAHIETRTPYTAAERDDTEVPLDNPNLKVPVYWLGRNFVRFPCRTAAPSSTAATGITSPPARDGHPPCSWPMSISAERS